MLLPPLAVVVDQSIRMLSVPKPGQKRAGIGCDAVVRCGASEGLPPGPLAKKSNPPRSGVWLPEGAIPEDPSWISETKAKGVGSVKLPLFVVTMFRWS